MKNLNLSLPAALALLLTACFEDKVTEPPALEPVAADTALNVYAFLPATAGQTVTNLNGFLAPFAVKAVANLRADSAAPAFTYFSFATGAAVSDTSTGWDLAFRSTTFKVNGQFQLITGDFANLAAAPATGYADSGNTAWYDYSGAPNHLITPKANLLLVVKTKSGKYAKLQFQNYYKGAPAAPNGLTDTAKYYSFRYAYQADGSTNLAAALNGAPKTYYSLRTGLQVDSASQWDIAFRSTAVTVNGEAQVLTQGFDALTTAPAAGYSAAAPAWYDYSGAPNHTITAKPGTVLAIKTLDGKYAKVQILSYYKNSPAAPNGLTDTARYFTFKYYFQADGSTNLASNGSAAPRTFFSLRTGATVADSTAQWDIAFRSTTISVNGEAQLLSGANFEAVAEVPATGYAPGSVPTWYDYNLDGNHTVTPKVGAVIALKTLDGKYAKVQVFSYYKDKISNPVGTVDTARYYSFRWVLQGNGTRVFE